MQLLCQNRSNHKQSVVNKAGVYNLGGLLPACV